MWPRQQGFFSKPNIALIWLLCMLLALANAAPPKYTASSAQDRNAKTIYYTNKPADAAGRYNFEFQTTNGITTKGAGNEHGAVGVVQYVSLEGLPITLTYTADADGYKPEGKHLPVVPGYVLRSLEYIRTHPKVDERKSRRL